MEIDAADEYGFGLTSFMLREELEALQAKHCPTRRAVDSGFLASREKGKTMALKQWRMKNGEWVDIANMSTSHIEACLTLLRRKGYIGASTVAFYLTCPEPGGDMASLEFDRECDEVYNAKIHPAFDELEAELKRRRAGAPESQVA